MVKIVKPANKKAKDNKQKDVRITKKMKDLSPTLKIAGERDIAMDFSLKVYNKFDQLIKSIVLFGSAAKKLSTSQSDIDIVIIIDDVAMNWDDELIAWYREELGKIIQANPYRKNLHVNTVKLSTWWEDLLRGDPIVTNILRYGETLLDYGGFFNPLKILLQNGKIRPSPESIYTLLQRSISHLSRARQSIIATLDGIYWSMTDAAHAALIAGGITPASPEEIGEVLRQNFVKKKLLKNKFADYYEEVRKHARKVVHGETTKIQGKKLDKWFEMSDVFIREMAKLVDKLVKKH